MGNCVRTRCALFDAEIVEYYPDKSDAAIERAIVWLHGLGADGSDFVPIVPHLRLNRPTRFIFPNAPKMPVTVNGGRVMSAWYDILRMDDLTRQVDIAHIEQACERILAIVRDQEAKGVAPERTALAGFSQGGAVAYHAAASVDFGGLGGLLALSTYFASAESVPVWRCPKDTPILACHGDFDAIVSPALGKQAAQIWQDQGYSPAFKSYPMAHQVCPSQIDDIGAWLRSIQN